MKALWIAIANLRRMFRVRTNIFFVFVFPMVLILVVGATFGGSSSARLGVVTQGSGPLTAALVRQLDRTPGCGSCRSPIPRHCSRRWSAETSRRAW